MASLERAQIERWTQYGTDGLREMQAWLAANPGSPFAPIVTQVVAATQQQLEALATISKKLLRAELLVRKQALQAEIDAITRDVGA